MGATALAGRSPRAVCALFPPEPCSACAGCAARRHTPSGDGMEPRGGFITARALDHGWRRSAENAVRLEPSGQLGPGVVGGLLAVARPVVGVEAVRCAGIDL